jgi:apolipoprotein D and lipocalin family protein
MMVMQGPTGCARAVLLSFMAAAFFGGCAKPSAPPLEVVPTVDLNRYAGTWYEIARYPHRFQKDCAASKATYRVQADGTVRVKNECRKGTLDGEPKSVEGKAWVVDPATNAKLKVRFFWPFSGDYWIIDLGTDYDYAAVGHPSRKYLWVLSRTPQMDDAVYAGILDRLRKQHYDTERLVRAVQPVAAR